MYEVVKRVVSIFGPGTVAVHFNQPLHADLADARRHAAGLHRLPLGLRVLSLDARIAGDAFLRDSGIAPVHRLLVRAGLDTLAVATALLLVYEHDSVLGSLVDRLARTGGQTGRITAMVTDARQIEEPGLMLRKLHASFVEFVAHPFFSDRVIFVDIGRIPLLIAGQIAEHPSAIGGEHLLRLENRLAVKLAVRSLRIGGRLSRPALVSGVGLFQEIEDLDVPELGISSVGFRLYIGPPHLFLAFVEGPGGLACHGAALAGDAAVGVEDEGKLTARESRLVRVSHLPADLPVMNFGHVYVSFPLSRSIKRTEPQAARHSSIIAWIASSPRVR